jgi:2-dehydro-3-deoxygluconokinase
MTSPAILCLGEALVEFNQTRPGAPEYLQGFGGDTSNAAIAAARQGVAVAYLSRVGRDEFGKLLLELWRRENVDASGVRVDENAPTGVYFVTHGEDGHRFSYLRRGSAASGITPDELDRERLSSARFLHVSAISQAISASACDTAFAAMEVVRAAGGEVSYDTNLRLQLWPLARARATIRASAALADVLLPSVDDARLFTGLEEPDAIVDWCLDAGARMVVLKQGAAGVLLATGEARCAIAGYRVRHVDATGAGDCFAGCFLARLTAGDEPAQAARYANVAAALSTRGFGAVAPIPRPAEVLAALAR